MGRKADRAKLREARENCLLTIPQAAHRSGVSERAIKYAESPTSPYEPSPLVLRALAKAYGLNVKRVTFDDAEPVTVQ